MRRAGILPGGRCVGGVDARPLRTIPQGANRGRQRPQRARDRVRLPKGVLNTTTPGGKLVFYVFGAVAEFEREIIRERTMAGLEAARARGRKPVKDEKKLALASAMLKNREVPVREVCEAVGASRSTLYRHLKPDGSAR